MTESKCLILIWCSYRIIWCLRFREWCWLWNDSFSDPLRSTYLRDFHEAHAWWTYRQWRLHAQVTQWRWYVRGWVRRWWGLSVVSLIHARVETAIGREIKCQEVKEINKRYKEMRASLSHLPTINITVYDAWAISL